ncbi:MAG: hypothetical protein K8S25_01515 [Alphaproteobacteria bacterium]|nr:hypothetical protein [Alphaproteobacteria bacterium]
MIGSKRYAAAAAIVVSLCTAMFVSPAAADSPLPIESTLSYQMLQIEAGVRPVSSVKFALLRSVLERATAAAANRYSRPRTRRDAIDALDAVQVAIAEHNFIIPTARRYARDSLADAFEPLNLSGEERKLILAPGEVNGFRARYVDPSKPLYFVNDALGSQLIISVGQRMGWDIRLVSVGDHHFVRWHLNPTLALNWDWTAGGPSRNEDYAVDGGPQYREWPQRRRFLRSLSAGYARANYLLLISRRVDGVAGKRKVLELAMASDPTHEQVQNSLAWLYATDPALARSRGRLAVQYALSAWAATPRDADVADTVACAFAATGERGLAVQAERFAIERLREERRSRSIPEFEGRLRQIQDGGTCSTALPDEDDEDLQ